MNKKLRRGGLGAGLAGLVVLALGLVLNNQAAFSKSYVHDQLVEHKITFIPLRGMTEAQRAVPCLVKNAGKPLTTGAQAECYAKYQIGGDMQQIAGGKGYSEVHYGAYLLRMKMVQAVAAHPDDPATAELVRQSDDLSRKGDDLLAGESVKGLLLTAYGFGLLGERGGQAAMACFAAGGLLELGMLLSVAIASGKRRPTIAGADDAGPEPALGLQVRQTADR